MDMMPPVTNAHVAVLDEIVTFLQGKGWDVVNIEVYRFDDADEPFAHKEAWQAERWKWGVRISTKPRDQDKVLKSVRQGGTV